MKTKLFLFPLLTVFMFFNAYGQKENKKSDKPLTVTGTVTGPDNQPVAGAVIYVDNIKTSYVTSEKGTFRIKISPSAYKLKVTSSRFGSIDTLFTGQANIDFNFSSAEGTETVREDPAAPRKQGKKKMVTYTNIYQMIQNECSGVLVSGRKMVIQQPNSFFGSTDPLLVVNGVIVQSIDHVNPVEVKSIQVLTGSQASLYGVQGANGVISITLVDGSDSDK